MDHNTETAWPLNSGLCLYLKKIEYKFLHPATQDDSYTFFTELYINTKTHYNVNQLI